MIQGIFKSYRKNLLSVVFLIIGYVIGILSLSVGISIISDVREYSLDSTSGNPDDLIVSYVNIQGAGMDFSDITSNIVNNLSKKAEVQLINFGDIEVNNELKASIVPDIAENEGRWHIPVLQGRYFSEDESAGVSKVVIIGRNLAASLFPQGIDKSSTIEILNETYRVIGVCGRKYRDTQWDDVIYIPFNAMSESVFNNFNRRFIENEVENKLCISLFLRKSDEKVNLNEFVDAIVSEELNNSGYVYDVNFETIESRDNSSLFNSIIATSIIAGMILIIVVINVMNLSLFWIFNRKREICIKKMLGATDTSILVSLILETTLIAVFSALCALGLQLIISNALSDYLKAAGLSCELSVINFIICFVIAIICGLVSSLFQLKRCLRWSR